jgi:hypothetical protein
LKENEKYDLVDWENLLEEIRCLGEWYIDRAIDFMTEILESGKTLKTKGMSG